MHACTLIPAPQPTALPFCCGCCCRGCCFRYKLSLLAAPGSSSGSQPATVPPVSFKDFSSDKASSKAKKAAAGAKGFGAGGGSSTAAAATVGAAELTEEQLAAVVGSNALAASHVDGVLALCRQQQQQAVIGVQDAALRWRFVATCDAARWQQRCSLLRAGMPAVSTPHATPHGPRRVSSAPGPLTAACAQACGLSSAC